MEQNQKYVQWIGFIGIIFESLLIFYLSREELIDPQN